MTEPLKIPRRYTETGSATSSLGENPLYQWGTTPGRFDFWTTEKNTLSVHGYSFRYTLVGASDFENTKKSVIQQEFLNLFQSDQQNPPNEEEAAKALWKIKMIRNFLASIAFFSFIAMVVFLALTFSGVWHWAVWLPGAVGAFGVFGANAIHVDKLDEAVKNYEFS